MIWPAEPPDFPQVLRPDELHERKPWGLGPGALRRYLTVGSGVVDIPEDFVLRECRAVDPADDDQVMAFVARWGSLAVVHRPRDPFDSLPDAIWDVLGPGRRYARTQILSSPGNERYGFVESERLHLQVLRALGDHYCAGFTGEDVTAAWASLGVEDSAPDGAWNLFAGVMDAALSAFPMHVRIRDAQGQYWSQARQWPTTYEVAVLQLARIIAEHRPVATCANERCRGLFTRQRGRSRYAGAEHARGVKYCSATCAKAQGARERRAREKAQQGGGGRESSR